MDLWISLNKNEHFLSAQNTTLVFQGKKKEVSDPTGLWSLLVKFWERRCKICVSDAKIQAELQKGHLGDSKRRHGNQMIFWDTRGFFWFVFCFTPSWSWNTTQRCNFPHFIPLKLMFCHGPWPPMQTQKVHLLASWLDAVLKYLQCKTVSVIFRRADQMMWRKVLFEKKKKNAKRDGCWWFESTVSNRRMEFASG